MSVRRFLVATVVLVVSLVGVTPAFAQKSPATIQNEINSQITSNGTGAITGAIMRSILTDITTNLASPYFGLSGYTYCSGSAPCTGAASVGVPAQYVATSNGLKCDGVTDDSAAANALVSTVSAAGGGQILFNGECVISSRPLMFPNGGGGSPYPTGPLLLYGTGSTRIFGLAPAGHSALKLTYNPGSIAVTASITSTTMTVTATGAPLWPGLQITGSGVATGTTILGQLTGAAGGTGTYTVSKASTVTSEAMTATLAAHLIMTGSTQVDMADLRLEIPSDCTPALLVTNTAFTGRRLGFIGSAANYAACNDAILWGGSGGASADLTIGSSVTAPFTGYPGSMHDITLTNMRSAGTFNTYANAIYYDRIYFDPSTGSNSAAAISAATNASPVVLTVPAGEIVSAAGTLLRLPFAGGSGSWAALNGLQTATVIDGTHISVAVDSTAFGALTGSLVFYNGTAFSFNGSDNNSGENHLDNLLVEAGNYAYVARVYYGSSEILTNVQNFDNNGQTSVMWQASTSGGGHYIESTVGPGNASSLVAPSTLISQSSFVDRSGQSTQGSQSVSTTGSQQVFAGQGTLLIKSLATVFSNGSVTFNSVPAFVGGATFSASLSGQNASSAVTTPGDITGRSLTATAGVISIPSGYYLQTTGSSKLYAPSNGLWELWNNAQSGFTGLLFGCYTTTCPGLYVSSTQLQTKLADSSAFASHAAANFQYETVYSAAGTALPTCNSGNKGIVAQVSDATTPTYNGAYTSGGAVYALAFCNGTGWVMH